MNVNSLHSGITTSSTNCGFHTLEGVLSLRSFKRPPLEYQLARRLEDISITRKDFMQTLYSVVARDTCVFEGAESSRETYRTYCTHLCYNTREYLHANRLVLRVILSGCGRPGLAYKFRSTTPTGEDFSSYGQEL